MKMYSYCEKGQLKKAGSLQILHLVLTGVADMEEPLCAGSSKKKPLSQQPEFQHFFSKKNGFTLLKKYQRRFIQTGSYSKKGVQYFLDKGLISDQDFVWKEGFSSWLRLSICEEFHTNLSSSIEDLMDKLSLDVQNIPPTEFKKVSLHQRSSRFKWNG